jgi:16S rRNA (guanine527-N7)-methyltransferase
MFIDALETAANSFGLNLTPEQIKAFAKYNELLIAWNEKINLTAITDPQEVAVKHMVDSLACLDDAIFVEGCSVIDVGTGAGFPGLPLKIVRPDIKLTLLDSLNKRLLFLQDVVDQLGLAGTELIHARAEDAGRNSKLRAKYHIAVSRAVARLNVLAELCLPFVRLNGFFVALKGAQFCEEVSEAESAIVKLGGQVIDVHPVKLPGIDDKRAIVVIKKIADTPAAYPRRPGIPEKKPL